MVDIDPAEMKKPTIHVDMPVHADAKDFFEALLRRTEKNSAENPVEISAGNRRLFYGQISFFQVYCSQEQQILHFVMSAISNSDFC